MVQKIEILVKEYTPSLQIVHVFFTGPRNWVLNTDIIDQ